MSTSKVNLLRKPLESPEGITIKFTTFQSRWGATPLSYAGGVTRSWRVDELDRTAGYL